MSDEPFIPELKRHIIGAPQDSEREAARIDSVRMLLKAAVKVEQRYGIHHVLNAFSGAAVTVAEDIDRKVAKRTGQQCDLIRRALVAMFRGVADLLEATLDAESTATKQ